MVAHGGVRTGARRLRTIGTMDSSWPAGRTRNGTGPTCNRARTTPGPAAAATPSRSLSGSRVPAAGGTLTLQIELVDTQLPARRSSRCRSTVTSTAQRFAPAAAMPRSRAGRPGEARSAGDPVPTHRAQGRHERPDHHDAFREAGSLRQPRVPGSRGHRAGPAGERSSRAQILPGLQGSRRQALPVRPAVRPDHLGGASCRAEGRAGPPGTCRSALERRWWSCRSPMTARKRRFRSRSRPEARRSPQSFPIKPQRKLTVYILPHSHTDIGYTEIQTDIEEKQVNNLLQGIAYARRTADYPEGARFVWNVEVLWAADLYLQRLSRPSARDFLEAVKRGPGRAERHVFERADRPLPPGGAGAPVPLRDAARPSRRGVPIDSAMISDVPGYTWGTVTAMAQAGIKYFSAAPNYFDRIGDILVKWENKPFWWVGPVGKEQGAGLDPVPGLRHVAHRSASCRRVRRGLPGRAGEDGLSLRHRLRPLDRPWRQRRARPGDLRVRARTGTRAMPGRGSSSPTSEAFRAFERATARQLPGCAATGRPTGKTARARRRRDRAEPRQRRPARPGGNALGHARPGELSGRRVRGGLEQRAALLRAHLGRPLQHHRAGQSRTQRAVGDQAVLTPTQANLQSRELLVRRWRSGRAPATPTVGQHRSWMSSTPLLAADRAGRSCRAGSPSAATA